MILLGQIFISLKTLLCLVSMATVPCKSTLKWEVGRVFSQSLFVCVPAHLSGHTKETSSHHLNLQLYNFLSFLVNTLRKLHVCVPVVSAGRGGGKLSIQVEERRLNTSLARWLARRVLCRLKIDILTQLLLYL